MEDNPSPEASATVGTIVIVLTGSCFSCCLLAWLAKYLLSLNLNFIQVGGLLFVAIIILALFIQWLMPGEWNSW